MTKNISIENYQALSVNELADAMKLEVAVLDTRNASLVEYGFIPKSIYIDLEIIEKSHPNWLSKEIKCIVIAENGAEMTSIDKLTKVSKLQNIGYLKGGFEAWKNADKRYDMIISIDLEEFELDVKHTDIKVIDVRDEMSWKAGHLKKAIHTPLSKIDNALTLLDKDDECLIYGCNSKESMMAVTYLRSNGYQRVKNVESGYNDIKMLPLTFDKVK